MLSLRIKLKEKEFSFLKNNKGFTLVETLIAITLVTVGLLGAVTLIIYAISVTSLVRGKLIASQLAQEGVEVVRNIRDNNWLAGKIGDDNWYYGLNIGKCVPILSDENPAGNWELTSFSDSKSIVYFNEDDLFYGQSGNGPFASGNWGVAPFNLKRWLDITYVNNRLEVVSHIDWSEKGKTHSFEIKDYLYNWQKGAGICPPGYTNKQANSSGISYYAGSEDDACTGQEMVSVLFPIPFRSSFQGISQEVCVSETSSSQTYCSSRLSSVICDEIIGCGTADVYLVVDPL